MDLNKLQQQLAGETTDAESGPPVDKWDPEFCGDMNMQIQLDGRWFYEGTPIGRRALVKLFASVLKKEGDNYYLVTPVEKLGISVADVPFVITNWRYEGDVLVLTTQTDEDVHLTQPSQIALRQPPVALADENATAIPYIKIRRNLWGRLHHNVYYQLIEQATQISEAGETALVIGSNGHDFVIGRLPSS
ncbi:DUF1285 domain-containing protein [Alteromonas halophila]|uniref:DUF1285 domain-containing protein n=1 Tax=Alteromonas halophila TaxID=516698 RepID=A0A918JN35_9ALTE|nr:DUF1285 domain-containing protein [Alteromonas halophila]GGW91445.1 hypothetical protein GCM10007391_27260 [Alteromonas halophila]